jgi:hypothetical protein
MIFWSIVIALISFDIWLLLYLRIIKFPKFKKENVLIAKPINPNSSDRPCQFCGNLPTTRSVDGYFACAQCMVIKLHHVGTIRHSIS